MQEEALQLLKSKQVNINSITNTRNKYKQQNLQGNQLTDAQLTEILQQQNYQNQQQNYDQEPFETQGSIQPDLTYQYYQPQQDYQTQQRPKQQITQVQKQFKNQQNYQQYKSYEPKQYTEDQLIHTVVRPLFSTSSLKKQQNTKKQEQQQNSFYDVYATLDQCSMFGTKQTKSIGRQQSKQQIVEPQHVSQCKIIKQGQNGQIVAQIDDKLYTGLSSQQNITCPEDFDRYYQIETDKYITKFNQLDDPTKLEGRIIDKQTNRAVYKGGLDNQGRAHLQGKLFQADENYIIGNFDHGQLSFNNICEQRIDDIVYTQVEIGQWSVKHVDNNWYFDGQITKDYQFLHGIITDCIHDRKYNIDVENGITKTQILQKLQ